MILNGRSVRSKRTNYLKCVKIHTKILFVCVLLYIFPVLVQLTTTDHIRKNEAIHSSLEIQQNIAKISPLQNGPKSIGDTRSDTYFQKYRTYRYSKSSDTQKVAAIPYPRYFIGDINNAGSGLTSMNEEGLMVAVVEEVCQWP